MVPEERAKTLKEALASMRWERIEGDFALLGFPEPLQPEDLALLADEPAQAVREGGESTLLVRAEHVAEALRRHPLAQVQLPLSWIRFRMPMDWQLVGFLALVSGELAAAGVPIGAVCGYSRDHLFVAREHLAATERVLTRLFPSA
ncbi:MAG: hypothetical protein L6Q99_11695 [Planctomycetes bacterium]|nr:hypothetical protein [Planctomycetota bacterium]